MINLRPRYAPTPAPGNNSTRIATSAFVVAALASYTPSGSLAAIATSGSASDLIAGTVPNARLSAQVARLDLAQTFAAKPTFSAGADFTNGFRVFDGVSWGSFYGSDGTLETDFNIKVDGSVIADDVYCTRINSVDFENLARRDAANTWAQAQIFANTGYQLHIDGNADGPRLQSYLSKSLHLNPIGNSVTFPTNNWHSSWNGTTEHARFYFGDASTTYFQGHGSIPFVFRNGTGSDLISIASTGAATFNGPVQATSAGSHVFGTTNTVAMSSGSLTATFDVTANNSVKSPGYYIGLTSPWLLYDLGGGYSAYRDMTNARQHVTLLQGANAAAALTQIHSRLEVEGAATFNGNVYSTGSVTSAFQSLSANPSTLDIPAGMHRVVKNTTSGDVRDWVNDGGVMKSSPAYT